MDTTIKTIEHVPTTSAVNLIAPIVPTVSPSLQISKVIINRITRDMQSKSEMILRETHVTGLLVNSYGSNRHGRHFTISVDGSIKDNLKHIYGKQISDNDNTLKQLRDAVSAIETQYRSCITNYGLKFEPPSYRNPFTELNTLLNDEQLGTHLATQRYDTLRTRVEVAKLAMTKIAFNLITLIDEEAKRLNSREVFQRKQARIRLLQEFAENKLLELITIRENLKRDITNEYQKYQTERVTKSYEEHGPTAIL